MGHLSARVDGTVTTINIASRKEEEKMRDKYYAVMIPVSIYLNDAAAPCVSFDTYEEATVFAKPLVEQGYDVVISIEFYEDDRTDEECIENGK